MAIGLVRTLSAMGGIFRQSWPLAQKELRVASRRRRTFAVRFLCAAVLTALVGLCLSGGEQTMSDPLQTQARSLFAMTIVSGVVWFELFASQFLAMLIFSTSISEEIQSRTLAVLLTTPMTAVQVVLGKLIGRLPHVLVLMALALPALAIVRVFGGVPWGELLGCFCVMLCGAITTAAATVYASTRHDSTVKVCFLAVTLLMGVYFLIPLVLGGLAALIFGINALALVFFNSSPFVSVTKLLEEMQNPGRRSGASGFLTCLILLGQACLWLLAAMGAVHKAMGDAFSMRPLDQRPDEPPPAATARAGRGKAAATPVPVVSLSASRWANLPVTWREIQANLGSHGRSWLMKLIFGGLIAAQYLLFLDKRTWHDPGLHAALLGEYLLMLSMGVLIGAAGCLAWERRDRSLPFLLTTTLSEGQILGQKVLGSFYHFRILAYLFVVHCLFFTLGGVLPTRAMLVLPLGACILAMLAGMGLVCACLFRDAVAAVMCGLVLPVVFLTVVGAALGFNEVLLFFIPPTMPTAVFCAGRSCAPEDSLGTSLVVALICLGAGWLFFYAATRLLRRGQCL